MTPSPSRLLNEVKKRRGELASLCRDLIRIRSPSGREKSVADLIESRMRSLRYDEVIRDKVGDVVGLIEGARSGPSLMLDGHMDTVSEGERENWGSDPYGAELRGGIIHGRGASDMKGALASMIFAGSLLKEYAAFDGRLIVACVAHEEDCEGFGARHVIDSLGRPDYVVLGEATSLNLAIGHRGRVEVELIAYGRTAHGSAPERGVNAIELMIPVLEMIKEGSQRLPSHQFLGRSTVSVNRISCSPNETAIIPDKCRIVLDRRIVPGETQQSILSEYRGYLEAMERREASATYNVAIAREELTCYTGYRETTALFFPAWVMDRGHPLVQAAATCLRQSLGKEVELTRWHFSTDGAYTAGTLGIPTIGFGPGEEDYAHTPYDQITVKSLLEATRGYCSLALALLKDR